MKSLGILFCLYKFDRWGQAGSPGLYMFKELNLGLCVGTLEF